MQVLCNAKISMNTLSRASDSGTACSVRYSTFEQAQDMERYAIAI